MKEAINKVVSGQNLTLEQSKDVMRIMLGGEATQAQLGSFLTALRMKGETIDEIVGCATVMQELAEHVKPKTTGTYIDLVGTGGDGANTFNISTTSAFVASGAGVPIAKHGNRAISSRSGAADVLEALGINIMLEADKVEKCIEEVGMGFMFAQIFNKAMKNVGQARKDMGIRTIFNILGPVSNPSNAKGALIGVYSEKLTEPLAMAMSAMGVERGIIACGNGCMDEITNTAPSRISEIKDGKVISYEISPEDFGISRAAAEDIKGGTCEENAQITMSVLNGEKGPKRDIVLMNAGAAIYVGGKASSIEEGIQKAAESIDSKAALNVLNKLVEFTKNS
ncbi:MAG: anthranilate phosphoribosyltransferase [Clostridia bacterium]|nr:anthranilate phosphoribosyltransferase [Clostridia bacterium]